MTGDNGLLVRTEKSVLETEKAGIKEIIRLECIALDSDIDLKGKTDKEKLEMLVENLKARNGLEEETTDYLLSSKFVAIETKNGAIFTVL